MSNDGTYVRSYVPPNRARINTKMVVHIMDNSAVQRNADLVVFIRERCTWRRVLSNAQLDGLLVVLVAFCVLSCELKQIASFGPRFPGCS